MDLTTAEAHEIGHALGQDHDDDHDDVMARMLDLGVRRLPSHLILDEARARHRSEKM